MESERVTIKIPRPLYERLQKIIDGSGFRSVNEFIVYVMRDLVALKSKDEQELSRDEIEAIKQKLKSLGYF